MEQNRTFRKVYNNFHDQLNKHITHIRKSKNVFIFVDKTQNLYGATILVILFRDFVMFYQVFLSPQVKQCVIISNKHGVYELLHELPHDSEGIFKEINNLNSLIPAQESDVPKKL